MKTLFIALSVLLSATAFAQSVSLNEAFNRSEPNGYYHESTITQAELNTAWDRSEPNGYNNESHVITQAELNKAWDRAE